MKFKLCSSVMLMLVLTSVGFADEHFPLSGQISRGPVNVRSGANTNFEIVTKLSQGEKIVILDKSYEWYKIQLPATANAFVRADYIKEVGDHGGEIIGNKVNIRSKADSNAAIVGQVVAGDYVKLTQKVNDWWQVQPPSGTFAWVHSSFVGLTNEPVPSAALQKPLKAAEVFVAKPKVIEKPVLPIFKTQGMLKAMAENVVPNVHYKIVAAGQTICYLKDTDNLDKFKDVVVSIDGVKDDTVSMLSHPIININKITLLL